MVKKAVRYLLLLLFISLPVYFFSEVVARERTDNPLLALFTGRIEYAMKEVLPYSRQLGQLGLDLRYMSGQREQNGIFISESGLMRNIDQPMQPKIDENVRAISAFAQQLTAASEGRKSTYLAIVPTASGVLQQNLPSYASGTAVEQQRLIEEIYRELNLQVRTIDAFSALHNRREQYIYYRTDNNLTSLGGYYTYSAVARRMEISDRSLSRFSIEYLDHEYYGDLYETPEGRVGVWENTTAPYRKVEPDIISVYHYDGNREYTLSKRSGAETRVYHTLYPRHRMELGGKLDVFLGGPGAVTEITNSNPVNSRLLVFGDKAALSVLPFLSNHYHQTTLVNLFQANADDLAAINPQQYDRVLFLYGIETFIQSSQPAQVKHIQWPQ